jgi:uncharacterized damage-inducible protein DinB
VNAARAAAVVVEPITRFRPLPTPARRPARIGIADNGRMTLPFPSPTTPSSGRAELFVRYLDHFRETVLSKVSALPEDELRRSRLPSGWTPLELLKHLRYVELRWIEWGFQGRRIDEPWGDRLGKRWHVTPDETLAGLTTALRSQGQHTTSVITGSDLDAVGVPGPRWDGAAPAALERVLFHLLQEYARHAGHLDIVAELAGGPVGE